MKNIWIDIKRCIPFIQNCKKNLCLIIIFSTITTIISIITPSFNGNIINKILNTDYNKAILLAIIVGVLQILLMICNLATTKNYLTFRKKLILNIRKKACRSVLNLSLNECQKKGQGNFLNKIKGDSSKITTYLNNIKDSVLVSLGNIGVLILIFSLNKIVGIYYFICTAIIFLVRYYGIKKSLYYREKNLEKLDENTNLLGQIVKGARDIKILKLKDTFTKKTDDSFDQIGNLEYKIDSYMDYSSKIAHFLESVFLGIMVLMSVILIKNNLLSTSDFVVIFMYRGNVFNFSSKFATLMNQYGQFSLSLNRILSIMDYQTETFGEKNMDTCLGRIELRNVTFSYDEVTVLNNFNLSIKENTFVSIVGKSGVGKTTIFSLLTKMILPDKGNIYLDDMDINDLSEECIRKNISLVTQQPFLFNLSIKENLSIIDDNFENIKSACKMVDLDKKIESLENGYDTVLEEDATNLSGGEKQRLAIARAILAKTKVILLDEITNNLDTESTNAIHTLIESMRKDYTIIMITHNLEISKSADRIIVLDNGKIVGDGIHKELLKENKHYQKLYRSKK
jgi:ABC-type bacteriocin/lantibiotic exporter with double-glycine peptidase domain